MASLAMVGLQVGTAEVQPESYSQLLAWSMVAPAMQFFVNPDRKVTFVMLILNMLSNRSIAGRVKLLIAEEDADNLAPKTAAQLRTIADGSTLYAVFTYAFGLFLEIRHSSLKSILRKQAEISNNLKLQAEKALANRNLVFSSISHELRNPLNCLLGSVEVVLKTTKDATVKELLGNARVCGDLLINMINNILDNAKADFNALTLDLTPNKMMSVIQSVWRAMSYMVTQKNLNGEIYLENRIPEYLSFDKPRFVQIIMNLLANSLKHTHFGSIRVILSASPYDGGPIEIKDNAFAWDLLPFGSRTPRSAKSLSGLLSSQNEITKNYMLIHSNSRLNIASFESQADLQTQALAKVLIRVQVIDSGCGIEDTLGRRLMNESLKPDEWSSMGLGIRITRTLVRAMSGNMTMKSVVGRGTAFMVAIPMEVASGAQMQITTEKPTEGQEIMPGLICLMEAEVFKVLQSGIRQLTPGMLCPRKEDSEMTTSIVLKARLLLIDESSSWCREIQEWPIVPSLRFDSGRTEDLREVIEKVKEFLANTIKDVKQATTIMLVDDDDFNNKIIKRFVTHDGYSSILTASNGQEAVDQFEREGHRIRIILMDNDMPILNGIEATKKILEMKKADTRKENVKIIGITGNVQEDKLQACSDAGMCRVLKKPVTMEELSHVMTEVLIS
jgi:signal transduction histidine kinase/CheY-like chemotaxis protein